MYFKTCQEFVINTSYEPDPKLVFIVFQTIEPSKEVAMKLLASGRQNFQTKKLGLDMLRELTLHHDYVLLLVQDGYYLEALRYARKTKVFLSFPASANSKT